MYSFFLRTTQRKSARFFSSLVAPRSQTPDESRREFILNILLIGSIVLSFFVLLHRIIGVYFDESNIHAVPPVVPLVILAVFGFLYLLSRSGKFVLAAYLLLLIYLLPITYTLFVWSIYTPQVVLTYALLIVMASVLLSTRAAFILTLILSGFVIVSTYLQIHGFIPVDLDWMRTQGLEMRDALVFVFTLCAITIVSWLSNREIEFSLLRAIASEKALQKERDQLEIKVEERTQELKEAQLEKMFHMYRFVEFGRMASGFFHDLINPLTTVSLNLEMMKELHPSDEVERAVEGTKKMEGFIQAMRKQLQKHEIKSRFSVNEEIADALSIVGTKARESKVVLVYKNDQVYTYGNPLRLNQAVTNLTTNAVDAYANMRRRDNRTVRVSLGKDSEQVIIIVQDFGCGIAPDHAKKIFDPFFTTKKVDAGTGLGLSICKTIIEDEFHGTLMVDSVVGKGTTFTIRFPIAKK